MNVQIKALVTVSFTDIFLDEPRPKIEELLFGIPTSTILTITAHFMAKIHAKEDDYALQREIINRWVNQQTDIIRNKILKKFDEISEKHGFKISFFNNITSLYFYQKLFLHYNEDEDRDLTADEELRLIKAYLLVSEIWTENEIEHLKQRPSTVDEWVAYLLPFQMTHNEIQSYKDFRAQLIKAIYFFRFLEQDKELGQYLPDFLKQYGLSTWHEYLRHTLIPYVLSISGSKSTVLVFDQTNRIETDYWDSFCIKLEKYKAKPDFLELRESPVFKIKEFNYLFYNYNFIIDKLYQSLQFVFSKLLIKKGIVKDFGDFKSKYYSERFSENFMFYKAIEHCISNQRNIIAFNGEELASLLGEKGPDYYIRVDNHILLIEFKDVLMGAGPKVSYNFQSISDEIERKLVKNEEGKAKGVGQLAKFINEIPKGGFAFDKYQGDNLIIYPMIVVTDKALTLFGINYLLENDFCNLVQPCDYKIIKHLSLMSLDTLLLFQDLFNENRVNFFDILIGYDYDYHQSNPNYKFNNMDSYFIDYINYNRIPSRDMPKILREFITDEILK